MTWTTVNCIETNKFFENCIQQKKSCQFISIGTEWRTLGRLQDWPIEPLSWEHMLTFKQREEWSQRWFRDQQCFQGDQGPLGDRALSSLVSKGGVTSLISVEQAVNTYWRDTGLKCRDNTLVGLGMKPWAKED